MRKTLIIGIALAMVLLSGSLFSAQANCGPGSLSFLSPCNWHFTSSCGLDCVSQNVNSVSARDTYRADATCQGAYSSGPAAPGQMGTAGF